jgi:hypothetical protein
MKFKVPFILVAAVMIAVNIHAAGTTIGDILDVATGGRATGMGTAYTAAGNDVESINYNPAGIADITKIEMQYMYWFAFGDIGVHNISYAQKLENFIVEGKVGISGVYRYMPIIANEGATDVPVNYYDFVVTGTYASRLDYFIPGDFSKNIDVGMNLKIIYENIGIYPLSAYALDLGAQYTPPGSNLKFGAALQNLGMPVKLISDMEPLPLTLRLGVAYTMDFLKDNLLLLDFDYIQDFYDTGQFVIGIEDSISKILFLRAGYNLNLDFQSPSYISLGIGLSITRFDFAAFSLSYTYRPVFWNSQGLFDSTHILALEIQM